MKEILKKYKYLIAGTSVIAVVALVFGVCYLSSDREAKAKEEAVADVTAQVDEIYDNVQELFTDDTYTMLADTATMEQVIANEEAMAELEGSENFTDESANKLNTAITQNEYAKQMIELRDMVKALFDENGVLVPGSDVASVQAKAEEVKSFKPEYVESIMPLINEAIAQAGGAVPTGKDQVLAQVETNAVSGSDDEESEQDTASADTSTPASDNEGNSAPPSNGGSTPPPSNNGSGSTPPPSNNTPPPISPDSDGDGVPDGEDAYPNDPNLSRPVPGDTNGDGQVTYVVDYYHTIDHAPTDGMKFATKKEMDDYMWENYPDDCGWYGNYNYGEKGHYE